MAHDENFKDPFNAKYLIAFIASFALPLLPAICGWYKIVTV